MRTTTSRGAGAAVCEPLEGRCLLAIDLGTLVGGVSLENQPAQEGNGPAEVFYRFRLPNVTDLHVLADDLSIVENVSLQLRRVDSSPLGSTAIAGSSRPGNADEF